MTTLRCFSIACCLLLSAESIAAQSARAAADRISGTWTGYMRPNGVPDDSTGQHPIRVELKLDGVSAVTGTVTGPPSPGIIRTGTFDSKTGALKFGVSVEGDANTYVFEGTVVQGSVTGRVTAGPESGVFILTKSGGASAATQQPGDPAVAAALRRSFAEVSGYVNKSADLVPADKYSYRPAQSVRTFGKLKQSVDACTAAYAGTPSIAPALGNIGHTNLHYGNIITYMRMLGLTPPSS